MKRTAEAVWRGGGKDGKGQLSTQSGVLKNSQYSFSTRFENGTGTNPEELIGAAHAGCYSMALAFALNEAGFTADEIKTTATVNLENKDGNWTVSEVQLSLNARVPRIDQNKFTEIAENAKANCPISRLLNTKITLKANLESSSEARL